MLSYIPAIHGGVARLLKHRVALLLLMIGVSYLVWDAPAIFAILSFTCAVNTSDYYTTLPNGNVPALSNFCVTCHTTEAGGAGSGLGPFGQAYQSRPQLTLTNPPSSGASLANKWDFVLATTVSANGYTYGEKLQDPTGVWSYTNNPYTPSSGNPSRVVNPNDPNALPPQPQITSLNGVTNGGSYQGTVGLGVTLDTTVGARKVVYDILSGANVVKSYTKQTNAIYGGYTPTAATFDLAWDSNDVPNGTYTVRATLSDARTAGARTWTATVPNVTINNPSRTLRYVATSGSNVGGCTNSASPCATIDYAIAQSQANDEIRVAEGLYTPGSGTTALSIGTRVKLTGGYSTSNWTTPNAVAHPTKLDGQNQRTVLRFDTGSAGFTLQNLTIQHGKGDTVGGGGILVTGGPGTISNTIFDSNTTNYVGGGLYLYSAAGTVIQNAIFRNNTASQYGGAIASVSNFAASNVLFANNSSQNGGAIAVNFLTSATINYATIAGGGSGDAIDMLSGAGQMTLNDTLISGYTVGATVAAGPSLTLNKVLMANDGANNIATPTTGAGTVSGAPIRGLAGYKNAAGGDYHLLFGAPAIDAGVAVGGVTTDLDGLARPFTTALPNVVLTAPDIGAYEYSSAYGILYFLSTNLNVTLPVQAAHIQVNLTVPSVRPVTVQYATQDGDAQAGVDYTAMSGTLTIPPGDAEVLFDIPILASNLTTPRSFTINLSSPTIAQLNIVSSMMVTINPPDLSGPPRVVLSASAPNASRAGPVPGVFTLTRDRQFDSALAVNYTVGGSAVAGIDYAPLPGSVTFQPGQSDITIEVIPIGGSGDKLVTLTLTPDGAYLLGRSSATVGITGEFSRRVFLPMLKR